MQTPMSWMQIWLTCIRNDTRVAPITAEQAGGE